MSRSEIIEVLARGELVVMKSDTIYGVFASATNESAVRRLHETRGRVAERGFIVLVDGIDALAKMVNLREQVRARLEAIWSAPFATSVILSAENSDFPWLADARSSKATICFRIPHDKNLRDLLAQTGPLCAPSANLPDEIPARNTAEARQYFGDAVSLYVEADDCNDVLPSRIIGFAKRGEVKTFRSDGHNHPEDFVITRRRKLYRFAKFDELKNCFHFDQWLKLRDAKIPESEPLIVEIGAGSALFSVELARQNPARTFIAIDIKGDRLYQGAREAKRLGLENIYFVRSDIAQINEIIPNNRADEIWLTFPDPYPRKPDAKHRLTAPRYLNYYQQMLKKDAPLNFKTDNAPLFDWSVEQFTAGGWHQQFFTRDLHNSDALNEAKIMTTYEQRFVAEGLKIMYVRLTAS